MAEIFGTCPPRLAAVKDAFAASFDAGDELGARFSLVQEGEVIVDLWGGFADRKRTVPFGPQTLACVFSTTKAIAALLIARAVEAGRLSYDQRVADLWPEFAQAGKGEITVGQAMSHQAGLSGFVEPMEPSLWADWDAIATKIAAATPLWPPGTASGYHPITFGFIAGELYRRAMGVGMSQALHDELAVPFGLDLWIGLPESEHGRVAEMQRPNQLPDFGPEPTSAARAAFLTPWASPAGIPAAVWRKTEVPSANGYATAPSLARLMGALADDGWLDGEQILSPALIAEATAERIRGRDLVLPFEMSWGAGFMRNETVQPWGPGKQTFGHPGWGGSCAFADPERKVGGGYVMNRQTSILLGDARPKRLIEAAYAAGM
jgi:CubicO group peptidase (beta-lactamase class C family)